MPFTNEGIRQTLLAIGSNLTNNYIQYYAIGIGSGTALVTNVTLVTESGTRALITGSPDFTTARKVTFQGDYNSVQMSGISLTEFGLFNSGASNIGSIWLRESFPAVTFDGTIELQISTTIEGIAG